MPHKPYDIDVVAPPGLEPCVAEEICEAGFSVDAINPGSVSLRGDRETIWRLNLQLRAASRVLVILGRGRARDFPALYNRLRLLPWGSFLRPGGSIAVQARCRESRLNHTDRIAETVRAAVGQALGLTPGDGDKGQAIFLRLNGDNYTVSLDSSGDHLHRRGYRSYSGLAPIRENLAAGILHLAGWKPGMPLVDLCCGSGTFLIEAARWSLGLPPGLERRFAFEEWPKHRSGRYRELHDTLVTPEVSAPLFFGCELDPAVAKGAADNIRRAGCEGAVRLMSGDFRILAVPDTPPGLVIANPPYGDRIGDTGEARTLYRDLGRMVRDRYIGWRCCLLAPDERLIKAAGGGRLLAELPHGGTRVGVYLIAG